MERQLIPEKGEGARAGIPTVLDRFISRRSSSLQSELGRGFPAQSGFRPGKSATRQYRAKKYVRNTMGWDVIKRSSLTRQYDV